MRVGRVPPLCWTACLLLFGVCAVQRNKRLGRNRRRVQTLSNGEPHEYIPLRFRDGLVALPSHSSRQAEERTESAWWVRGIFPPPLGVRWTGACMVIRRDGGSMSTAGVGGGVVAGNTVCI